METLFIVYAVWASAVIIGSTFLDEDPRRRPGGQTLRCGVEYVAIPSLVLREWAAFYPNLLVFDFHLGHERSGRHEGISGWLTISMSNLPSLLKWLPPKSVLVVCCREVIECFDAQIEEILLQLGVGIVYFLDESAGSTLNHCSKEEPALSGGRRRMRERQLIGKTRR